MKKYIYQIYYNEETRKKILPGFIPLDNTKNLRPDWFEFWVILNFLRNNTLENDTWYGFLSPKFQQKTGFNSAFVLDVIERYGDLANVALFSQGWDHIAYFINSFEQGEVFHPGLMRLSQDFIDKVGLEVNLKTLVSDSTSSGFSNYTLNTQKSKIIEMFWEHFWF